MVPSKAYKAYSALRNYFIFSVSSILFITAAAKILSLIQNGHFLIQHDAILWLRQWQVLTLSAIIELGLSAFLILGINDRSKLLFTSWLAVNFMIYHIGLTWCGSADPCNCLGNWNGMLAFPPKIFPVMTIAFLAFMIVGSNGFLLADWVIRKKQGKALTQLSGVPETV